MSTTERRPDLASGGGETRLRARLLPKQGPRPARGPLSSLVGPVPKDTTADPPLSSPSRDATDLGLKRHSRIRGRRRPVTVLWGSFTVYGLLGRKSLNFKVQPCPWCVRKRRRFESGVLCLGEVPVEICAGGPCRRGSRHYRGYLQDPSRRKSEGPAVGRADLSTGAGTVLPSTVVWRTRSGKRWCTKRTRSRRLRTSRASRTGV